MAADRPRRTDTSKWRLRLTRSSDRFAHIYSEAIISPRQSVHRLDHEAAAHASRGQVACMANSKRAVIHRDVVRRGQHADKLCRLQTLAYRRVNDVSDTPINCMFPGGTSTSVILRRPFLPSWPESVGQSDERTECRFHDQTVETGAVNEWMRCCVYWLKRVWNWRRAHVFHQFAGRSPRAQNG